jgi:hypothetical protein
MFKKLFDLPKQAVLFLGMAVLMFLFYTIVSNDWSNYVPVVSDSIGYLTNSKGFANYGNVLDVFSHTGKGSEWFGAGIYGPFVPVFYGIFQKLFQSEFLTILIANISLFLISILIIIKNYKRSRWLLISSLLINPFIIIYLNISLIEMLHVSIGVFIFIVADLNYRKNKSNIATLVLLIFLAGFFRVSYFLYIPLIFPYFLKKRKYILLGLLVVASVVLALITQSLLSAKISFLSQFNFTKVLVDDGVLGLINLMLDKVLYNIKTIFTNVTYYTNLRVGSMLIAGYFGFKYFMKDKDLGRYLFVTYFIQFSLLLFLYEAGTLTGMRYLAPLTIMMILYLFVHSDKVFRSLYFWYCLVSFPISIFVVDFHFKGHFISDVEKKEMVDSKKKISELLMVNNVSEHSKIWLKGFSAKDYLSIPVLKNKQVMYINDYYSDVKNIENFDYYLIKSNNSFELVKKENN